VCVCVCVYVCVRTYVAPLLLKISLGRTLLQHTLLQHARNRIPRVSTRYSMLDKQAPEIPRSLLNTEPYFSMALLQNTPSNSGRLFIVAASCVAPLRF